MKTERFKNPWLWVGVVSVALAAIGVDPQTFTYYAGQTPASLPALWSIEYTTNPAKAKAYMAPNGQSSMYMKNDCCTENDHVYQFAIDNNVWPPSGYPAGWADLGTVEDVQGAI